MPNNFAKGISALVGVLYNSKGQLVSSSEPYFEGVEPSYTTYLYYNDLRLQKVTEASTAYTNYTYSGNTPVGAKLSGCRCVWA